MICDLCGLNENYCNCFNNEERLKIFKPDPETAYDKSVDIISEIILQITSGMMEHEIAKHNAKALLSRLASNNIIVKFANEK